MHAHHHHPDPADGDRRVAAAIAINLVLTLVQIAGGLLSGSLALIADAVHNLSDAGSLVIAFAARRIARRGANDSMTFGYGRAEVVAALINYTGLAILGIWLFFEAAMRLLDPQPVDGWIVVVVAAVALTIDAATAALTYAMSKDSANIRAAFLHNLADALGSVAVIVAGTLVLLYDWRLIDPIITLGIAGYILWMAISEARAVVRILMLGSPPQIAAGDVISGVRAIPGVRGIHHVHLWQMGEHDTSLDAHLVIESGCWSEADRIKAEVKRHLASQFGIGHSTLEMECAAHACADAPTIGG